MRLELRLEWYDTATLEFQGEESSKDLGDDGSVLNALGISADNNIKKWQLQRRSKLAANNSAVFATSNRFESSRLSNFV